MPESLANLDPIIRQTLIAIFPALGLAGVLFVILWWNKGRRAAGARAPMGSFSQQWPLAWLGPIVVGLVSINVFMLLNYNDSTGWPSLLPGRDVRSLWPTFILIAVVLGVMTSLWRSDSYTTLRLILRGLLAAGIAALILRNVLKSTDIGSLIVTLAGVGTLAVAIMQGLERTALMNRGFLSAVLMFIPLATAGQVILIGFTEQTPAFAMVSLSVIIAVAGVAALIRPRLHLAYGMGSSVGLLLAIALFQSARFGSADGGQAAIYIGLLLLSIWLPMLIDIANLDAVVKRYLNPSRAGLVIALSKVTLAGVPAAAALGAAIYNKPPPI